MFVVTYRYLCVCMKYATTFVSMNVFMFEDVHKYVLDLFLFLIYIDDLPRAVKNSKMSMFANYTCLHHQSSKISQLNGAINEDRTHVENWLKGNKLSLKLTPC